MIVRAQYEAITILITTPTEPIAPHSLPHTSSRSIEEGVVAAWKVLLPPRFDNSGREMPTLSTKGLTKQRPLGDTDQAGSNRADKQRAPMSPTSKAGKHIHPSEPQSSLYAPTATLPTATPSHQDSAQSQNPSKVAIPRLRRNSEDQSLSKGSAVADKNRVSHACEPCRQRKTKCSGDRPLCQHCQDFKLPCVYADGKRDRTKK